MIPVTLNNNDDFTVEFQSEQELDVSLDEAQLIDVTFTEDESFNCGFESDQEFICEFGALIPSGDYDGSYTVTPSMERQTLPTANKTLSHNVVIDPIPSNYGLITWNGSALTVS